MAARQGRGYQSQKPSCPFAIHRGCGRPRSWGRASLGSCTPGTTATLARYGRTAERTGRPVSRILSPTERPGAIISLVPRVTSGILAPYLGLGGQRQRPCSGLLRVEFDSFHSRRKDAEVRSRGTTPSKRDIVSVPLVLASRRTGVTRYPAQWSADFPRSHPHVPPVA